jgi:hypothetical protein
VIRSRLTLILAWLAFLPLPASAAPIDTVLAALAAEKAAPIERVRLFIARGDVQDVYYIDRVRPGRFHMLKNPRQGGPEVIVVDRMQWARIGTAPWRKSPANDTTAFAPSMADLFRTGLAHSVEQAGPDGGRSIEGVMTWSNGTTRCEGKLLLRIDASLPSLLRFEGLCGGKPLHFRQAFSYVGPVTIAPP